MGTQKIRQTCEGNSLSWTCDFQNGNSSLNDFGSETQQSNISRKQGFPKLREILRRTRQDSDGMDCPDIEFEYSDADTHLIEVAEWYSYTEENEFALNRKSYQELMEEYGVHGKWIMLSELERKAVVMRLLEQVELSQRTQRLKGFRAMLYLVQGVFGECECEEEQQFWERQNVFLLYENGTFEIFVELLNMELDNGSAATSALRKPAISLADSVDLRLILSVLYTICEVLRLPQESDTDEMKRLRDSFKQELGQPTIGNELISVILLQMITRFCSGSAPHFPIKKILLLLWKVLLVSLGGTEELRVIKALYRETCDLPAEKEDTVEITRTMRAASPPASAADLIEAQMQRRVNRPYRRQPLVKQSSMDDSMAFQDLERDECNEEDLPEFSDSPFQMQKIQSNGGTEEYSQNVDGSSAYNEVDSSFPSGEDTPRPSSPVPPRFQLEDSPSVHSNLPNKGLPWVPKVRQKDIDLFLNNTRVKFVGFPLSEDRTSTAGLPQPIHEGLRVLQQHKYVSLSEVQVAREEEIAQNPVSQPEDDIKQNSTEIFYRLVLPNLPQYMIALLKILLAAAPTSKAKTESINIISDVLPEEMPITVPQSMKLGLDVNRHKEIIVKAVSGIILLIQKHFKINHIYQFEFVNQHLVFANCIPLILKFFNQNIMSYVQSKNAISIIDFPSCVIGEQPELTSETLCSLQEIGDNQLFCWRNMFSCINLLRILNKLTKWKQSRIMMLVVFKSAPILKRALKVKHAMMQLYVLKLLKMQTKYLGRQWRKSNMKTMSAIYQKVRHRLNDDWAYGNDMDARPWDFQAEECALRAAVDRFNHRRYDKALNAGNTLPANNSNMASCSVISGGGNNGGGGGGNGLTNAAGLLADLEFDYEPVDNCVFSVLGRNLELTDEFKKNYEIWLNQEVFQATVNWDQLLCSKFI